MRIWIASTALAVALAGSAHAQAPDPGPPTVVAAAPGCSPRSGVKLCLQAAEAGDAEAANTLGGMYADGQGVRRNNAEAVRWYRVAAERGDQWGQLNLGFNYSRGTLGLKKDPIEALRLYRLCAAQGNAFCQQNIGAMYANGQAGLIKDPAEARRWFIMAADQGNPSAQYNIGLSYLQGNEVFPKSDVEAAAWFGKVAAQADKWRSYPEPAVVRMVGAALYQLALLEGEGRGVAHDPVLQRRHMTKAAELRIAEAIAWLKANPG